MGGASLPAAPGDGNVAARCGVLAAGGVIVAIGLVSWMWTAPLLADQSGPGGTPNLARETDVTPTADSRSSHRSGPSAAVPLGVVTTIPRPRAPGRRRLHAERDKEFRTIAASRADRTRPSESSPGDLAQSRRSTTIVRDEDHKPTKPTRAENCVWSSRSRNEQVRTRFRGAFSRRDGLRYGGSRSSQDGEADPELGNYSTRAAGARTLVGGTRWPRRTKSPRASKSKCAGRRR